VEELEVRDRILLVATRLFAERGYGSTSVREVVEAAGVTKPTLYYWFANKEALFLEVVHRHLDGMDRFVDDVVTSKGSVRARLRRFVGEYVRGALDNMDAVKLLMSLKHPTTSAPPSDQPEVDLMSMHERTTAAFERLLQEGVDTRELRGDLDVRAAVVAFVGAVNLYLLASVHGRQFPPDFADTLLDLYFHGVAPQ
jgi:TetR/AcrR family transcriptional regulator